MKGGGITGVTVGFLLVALMPSNAAPTPPEISSGPATDVRGVPKGYWKREPSPIPACGRADKFLSVFVEVADLGIAKTEALQFFSQDGASELGKNCPLGIAWPTGSVRKPGQNHEEIRGWVKDSSLEEIKSRIEALGAVIHANQTRSFKGLDPATEDRRRILSSELEKNAKIISRYPHIEALVRAEILRLEPAARALQVRRDRTLVQAVLVSAGSK
ncbi:MAG: hypothetical protein HY927_11525 [Elusimicrobia bacterium]|nr:hypothetical protein [Elusimicrobiota bacterium]